jgi:hypothetical protein
MPSAPIGRLAIRTSLAASAAVLGSISLVYACSSSPADTPVHTDAGGDKAADARKDTTADAHVEKAPDARKDTAADAPTDAVAHDAVHATGDSGSASLDWFPGNYGLTDTGNHTARDAFLTGALSSDFDGVELIYPWTTCETTKNNYDACFTAIDGDLAALPTIDIGRAKHIILLLQYKAFGSGMDAVPAYLRASPGAWCEGTPLVCGQYTSSGDATAPSAIALIWNAAVAARLQAWFMALGQRYGHDDRIAGIVLPETATAGATANAGYSPTGYITAIKKNLTTLTTAFPTKPVFQYINFLPGGVPSQSAALTALAGWALENPHVGIGCPDVGGNSTFHPPGYDTLMSATYQHHLPFNVAIEPMDYGSAYTTGLDATFAEATGAAPGGMAAQFVVWWYSQGAGNVFTIDQVGAYVATHANLNTAPPM